MGFLFIDHRGGQNPDGYNGTLAEMDTASCAHCGKVIAVITRPTEKVYVDGLDLWQAHQQAEHLPTEYRHKRRCHKCRKNICRGCEASGVCQKLTDVIESWLVTEARSRALAG